MTDLHSPRAPLPRPSARRSLGKWLALGCTGLLVLCVVFVLGVGALVVGSIRRSGAYQLAVAEVRESPAVRQALGHPISEGLWVTGSVNVSGPSGEASLSFPVSGPSGRATVYVEATERAGEWELRLLEVRLAGDGRRLDLLDEAGASLETIRAFLGAAASGDHRTAHGYCAASLQEALPFEEFAADAASHAGLFRTRELRLTKVRGDRGPHYRGTLLLESGREVPASFKLLRENGAWRLTAFQMGS